MVLKVTKYTKCDDVIEMLAHLERMNVRTADYCVYETTSHASRAIQGRELIVKVWRSWGCESDSFSFQVEKKHTRAVVETGTSITALQAKSCNPTDHIVNDNLVLNKTETYRPSHVQDERSVKVGGCAKIKTEKQIVFAKFFRDLHINKSELPRFSSNMNLMGKLGGVSGLLFQNEQSNGQSENNVRKTDGICVECLFINETLFETKIVPNEELENAFVKSPEELDIDEGIDVSSVTSGDLNTAFVCDVNYQHVTAETVDMETYMTYESTHASRMDMFCSHGDSHVISEDDAMESFMRSPIHSR
ncbi:hypothetical protein DPMN_111437 [Dreissena polymorpha]|uniref:Ras-associating domain-containing protein n=1 Tax=Dreissena polymorpha TaxID=45954 RepID=A0A9D4KEW4_DREPO|nr:hypothetical protein DPMN_111437 [Dreissena polymorpha]